MPTAGAEWAPAGEPERVGVHGFVGPALGKVIPYGIYDLANNEGWVSVGDTADTVEFAVESSDAGGPRWAGAASLTPIGC